MTLKLSSAKLAIYLQNAFFGFEKLGFYDTGGSVFPSDTLCICRKIIGIRLLGSVLPDKLFYIHDAPSAMNCKHVSLCEVNDYVLHASDVYHGSYIYVLTGRILAAVVSRGDLQTFTTGIKLHTTVCDNGILLNQIGMVR